MATMTPSGMIHPKKRSRTNVDSIRPVNSTLCFSSSAMRGASSTPGMRVTVNTRTSASEPSHWRSRSPGPLGGVVRASGLAMPRISFSVRATFSTLSVRTSSRNFDIGISTVRGACSQDWSRRRTMAATST